MDNLVDIFNSNIFAMATLTDAVNLRSIAPSRISDLGIFKESGINTTSAIIERRGTELIIVPNAPRGGPATSMRSGKRTAISVEAPHLPVRDQLQADELQGVRAFGSADEMQGVQQKVDEKLDQMSMSLDNTLEYHRLGALQGQVLDADGETVILDIFDAFNVSQPDTVFLDLAADHDPVDPSSVNGVLFTMRNNLRIALNNQPIVKGVWAPCGDAFWQDLIQNPELRQTYLNQQQAAQLREDPTTEIINYGGVTFEHYPGFGNVEIPTDECLFVPLGVPNLFRTYFAPADWFSAVNRLGLPKYVMATLDETKEKHINIEAQSNPINICTRPEALFTGSRLAS